GIEVRQEASDYQAVLFNGAINDGELNHIEIMDWAGNRMFEGHYLDPEVDKILEANKCKAKGCGGGTVCDKCNDTGYTSDFEVYWQDETRECNVYEFIHY